MHALPQPLRHCPFPHAVLGAGPAIGRSQHRDALTCQRGQYGAAGRA